MGRGLCLRARRRQLTPERAATPLGLSLFWRTFVLLAILLAGGVFAWVQTLRAMEFEPRAVLAAQQTASLVNLTRAALEQADGINRVALVKTWARSRPCACGRANPATAGNPSRWTASRAASVRS